METGFSFPGGCVCVNKNEQWKTKAALCSSLCRERGGGRSAQREREREATTVKTRKASKEEKSPEMRERM